MSCGVGGHPHPDSEAFLSELPSGYGRLWDTLELPVASGTQTSQRGAGGWGLGRLRARRVSQEERACSSLGWASVPAPRWGGQVCLLLVGWGERASVHTGGFWNGWAAEAGQGAVQAAPPEAPRPLDIQFMCLHERPEGLPAPGEVGVRPSVPFVGVIELPVAADDRQEPNCPWDLIMTQPPADQAPWAQQEGAAGPWFKVPDGQGRKPRPGNRIRSVKQDPCARVHLGEGFLLAGPASFPELESVPPQLRAQGRVHGGHQRSKMGPKTRTAPRAAGHVVKWERCHGDLPDQGGGHGWGVVS